MADADTATRIGPDRLAVGPLYRLENIGQELSQAPVLDVVANTEITAPGQASLRRAEPGPPVELPGLAEDIVPAAGSQFFAFASIGGDDVQTTTDSFDEHEYLLLAPMAQKVEPTKKNSSF